VDSRNIFFTNQTRKTLYKDNWSRWVFAKALDKAGLRKVRIHELRHSYASLRIAKGDNIADVSNQLGHYSVKLTLDTYTHLLSGKKKVEVDGLDVASFMHQDAPHMRPEVKRGIAVVN